MSSVSSLSAHPLSFTLRGVDSRSTTTLSKKTSGVRSEKLIKSTKSLIIKAPLSKDNSFFDCSSRKSCLKTRFNVAFANRKGQEYPNDCTYPCDWCRRRFDTLPMGVPLSYKLRKSDKEENDGSEINYYTCDGYLCSFECTLAFIRKDASAYAYGRDPLYVDSENILRNLYGKLYPGSKLRVAPDWRLLRDNGGDLADEEASRFTPYIRTINVKLTPMSVVYQEY